MKKLLSLALAIIFCFSLFACGNKDKEPSVEDLVKECVKDRIDVELVLSYDITGNIQATYFLDEVSENVFEVTGKVTVKDKYGDNYSGKYDAIVEYNPQSNKCSLENLDIGKLYKD